MLTLVNYYSNVALGVYFYFLKDNLFNISKYQYNRLILELI